jgi:transcriptional regulator of acetoin/glycerol metabolism
VGGSRAIKVDYRLIAATHRSLDALVAEGHFRSDLLARVAAYTFHVPPARARADDVGLWVAAHVGERTLSLTPSAGRALLNYDWPLNIRELVHALDAATALACGAPLDVQHLPPSVTRRAAPRVASTRPSGACDQTRERLLVALSLHRGNVSAVARDLGKARMQVQRWMKQWGVDAASFRR